MDLVTGLFGKLPAHGDFLRSAPAQAPLDLIDAWLAPAGLGTPAGDRALDAAGTALALVEARGHWWALAMFPSHDSVGRRYPFCVLAGLPSAAFAGEPALVPQAFAPFLARCMQRSMAGWPGDAGELRDAVSGLGGGIDPDADGLRLADALSDHHMRGMWQSMLGRGDDPRRAAVFADAVAAVMAGESCSGLRLAPMAQLHHLAFWLMLLRLSGSQASSPSLIAIHPGGPSSKPSATVLWGRPRPEECLAAIWPGMPGADARRIHDPVAAPGRLGDPETAPEALDDLDLSLREVLHAVGSQTRRYHRPARNVPR